MKRPLFSWSLTLALALMVLAPAAPSVAQQTGAATGAVDGGTAAADQPPARVGITSSMPEARWTTPAGQDVVITRDQTPGASLTGDWALTGHDCPPFCIQPMSPAPGVTTIGELELIEAMKEGDTLLVDGRTPDWYAGGTIPGAINVPYTQAVERLAELGCDPDFDGKFDCAEARKVILFCNGIWCGQSPTAIRAMIEAGFPVERIHYYRGGMLAWRLLGLSVEGGATAAPSDSSAAQDVAPGEAAVPDATQDADQADLDGVTTPAENPVVDATTGEAAASDEAPIDDGATGN